VKSEDEVIRRAVGIPPPSAAATVAGTLSAAPVARGYWSASWSRLRANPIALGAAFVIAFVTLLAALAPVVSQQLTHYTYDQQDIPMAFAAPGPHHWLGTDELGRDTLTRLVFGARVSLEVAFLTVALYLTIGAAVGMVAAYYGGITDLLLMRIVDVLLAIPAVYLLILFATLQPFHLSPHSPGTLAIIIAIVSWGGLARLLRADVLSIRQRDFILATRSIGASDLRIMLRHILPNVLPTMIVAGSLGVGAVILLEAALDFISLGIRAPDPSWGNMLFNAQSYFFHSIWLAVIPGLAIAVTVISANLLGNALRDALDPRLGYR
jgi:peptide/nickel transport system permease protein